MDIPIIRQTLIFSYVHIVEQRSQRKLTHKCNQLKFGILKVFERRSYLLCLPGAFRELGLNFLIGFCDQRIGTNCLQLQPQAKCDHEIFSRAFRLIFGIMRYKPYRSETPLFVRLMAERRFHQPNVIALMLRIIAFCIHCGLLSMRCGVTVWTGQAMPCAGLKSLWQNWIHQTNKPTYRQIHMEMTHSVNGSNGFFQFFIALFIFFFCNCVCLQLYLTWFLANDSSLPLLF